MTELVLGSRVEIGRMSLNVSIDNSSDEGRGEIRMVAIIRPGDYINEGREISRENGVSCTGRQKLA